MVISSSTAQVLAPEPFNASLRPRSVWSPRLESGYAWRSSLERLNVARYSGPRHPSPCVSSWHVVADPVDLSGLRFVEPAHTILASLAIHKCGIPARDQFRLLTIRLMPSRGRSPQVNAPVEGSVNRFLCDRESFVRRRLPLLPRQSGRQRTIELPWCLSRTEIDFVEIFASSSELFL